MKTKQTYVAGFMFDAEGLNIALIRKQKPLWQKGKLNGIGGKIEEGEDAITAMVREFKEETDFQTAPVDWTAFASLGSEEWTVYFFCARGPLDSLRSPEEEQVEITHTSSITAHRHDVVENIPWLIPLALDVMRDGRPAFAAVNYPEVSP